MPRGASARGVRWSRKLTEPSRVLRFTDVTGSVGTVPKIRLFSSFPKAFFRSCVFHVTFLPLYLSNRVKGIGKSKQNVLFRSGMFYSINIKNVEGFS